MVNTDVENPELTIMDMHALIALPACRERPPTRGG
jgi:hypothetical protein